MNAKTFTLDECKKHCSENFELTFKHQETGMYVSNDENGSYTIWVNSDLDIYMVDMTEKDVPQEGWTLV